MSAVVMEQTGGPHVLRLQRVDRPEPGPGEVLVRVHAASVSHADLALRDGTHPSGMTLPHILGREAAGTVEEAASGVVGIRAGDRVLACSDQMGRDRNGAYAEFLVAKESELIAIPEGIGFITAASVGRSFATAWAALVLEGRIGLVPSFENRERVLVTAASTGVGAAAVQIARWKGATVVAVANGTKAKRLISLGAHGVVSRSADDLADRVIAGFDGRRATLILDLAGRDLNGSGGDMLEPEGRIVRVDALALIDENATIRGARGGIDACDMGEIFEMVRKGTFHPVIDSILPFSEAVAAHKRVGADANFGKVVLVPDAIYKSEEEELRQPSEKL